MLTIKNLRRELENVREAFQMIDDGNRTLETNFIANAIMVLEHQDLLGLTPSEAQLLAKKHYCLWAAYYNACKSVRFNQYEVPASFIFASAFEAGKQAA